MKRAISADYDLVIIGSGAAGMAAAIRASELGATAAVVESADVIGGTCVNIGCIPSKYFIEVAHHYHIARTGLPGIASGNPALAWADVLRRKDEIVTGLRAEKYQDVLDAHDGLTLLRGNAELLGGGRACVGEREVRAGRIVLATGTRPSLPPIPGLDAASPLDSTTSMELTTLPQSMIVIGGGAIGLELGQAFARFGVRITIVEAMERILPEEDPDVSRVVTDALRAEQLGIDTGANVIGVAHDGDGYTVGIEAGRGTAELRAEKLLVATGRRPNVEGLGLDAADVRTNARGYIEVDAYMRTSNPDVFAAGDVVGGPGFVYVAALGGRVAASAALADRPGADSVPIDLGTVPRVTFTDPQAAAVGLTQQQAEHAGFMTDVVLLPLDYLPRAIVAQRTRGMIKLVADAATNRLLGVHIVSPNAGDVIAEAVLAVRHEMTAQDLLSTLHPYLTWSEGLKLAAQAFTKDVATLSCCA